MRRVILMVAIVAASVIMPLASSAYQPVQCATCGDGGSGGKLTAGCNDVEKTSSSGDMSSFSTVDDPADNETYINTDTTLSGPGNWNLGFNYQVVDNTGTTVDQGSISPPGFNVPANGGTYGFSYGFSIGRVPPGGSVFVNVSGVTDYGATVGGEGQTMNYGCQITF